MKKQLGFTILSVLLAGLLTLSGCGVTSILSDILMRALSGGGSFYDSLSDAKQLEGMLSADTLSVISPEAPDGKCYYPYYASLDERKQLIYDRIVLGIRTMTETFPIDAKWNCTMEEICDIRDGIGLDHPEFFWFAEEDEYCYYTDTDTVCEYRTGFYEDMADFSVIEEKTAEIEAVMQRLLAATQRMSDIDAEAYFHDWLITNVTYEETYHDQSLYSALVERKTVCAGYSKAFQYLMLRRGVECYRVEGMVTVDGVPDLHTWNLVNLYGDYYYVDVTWDDYDDDEPPVYDYFNLNEAQLSETHERGDFFTYLPKAQ